MDKLNKSLEELAAKIRGNEEISSREWNEYAYKNSYYSSITMQTHMEVSNWEELKERVYSIEKNKNVNREIERLRKRLHETIEKTSLNSEEAIKISRDINILINRYYKNNRNRKRGRHYEAENMMDILYNKSYEHLKYLTNLEEFPSIELWNKYAKENRCLNSQSMQYISRYELA